MPTPPAEFVWYELMTTDLDPPAPSTGSSGADLRALERRGLPVHHGQGRRPSRRRVDDHSPGGRSRGAEAGLGRLHLCRCVDAATERVAKAGGRVQPPPTFPTSAASPCSPIRRAPCSCCSPPRARQPTSADDARRLGWRELYAPTGSGFRLLCEPVRLDKVDEMDMGRDGHLSALRHWRQRRGGGIMTKPAEVPHPAWGYYFDVARHRCRRRARQRQ